MAELTDGLQRGDKYQTLLGATGTGKSVGYEEPVFVVEDREGTRAARVVPIGPLIDQAMERAGKALRRDGDTECLDLPPGQYYTQAYDPDTGEVALHPVRTFTRHEAPAAMYRLKTACGRTVTLTGDHNLWVLREGTLQLIETSDARPTDYVPLPEALPEGTPRQQLNTLRTLAGERLFVEAPGAVLAYADREGVAAIARPMAAAGIGHPYGKLAAMRGTVKGRGGIAVDAFLDVLDRTDRFDGAWDPARARVGGKAIRNQLPAALDLTPEFLRLLGYYVAEGCHARGYVVLANRDVGIRRAIEDALRQLDLPFSVRPSSDYQVSSTALACLLGRLCGKNARTKHLPPFWPQLSQDALGHVLQAYFDGDGTVGRASAVTATTASARLASDLTYALLRFGIWARIRRRHKRATNADHAGDWYYQVSISGQDNLRRFAEHIGFSMSHKREALAAQRDRPGNSNVDVVPIRGRVLRRLRGQVQLSAQALGARSGVSRSAVQCYELEQRRPGRPVLRRMLEALRDEAAHHEVSEAWWEAWQSLRRLCDVRWTPIASVEEIAYDHPHVYDFTVPGPETFLAGRGGLFVHNTFSMAHVIQNAGMPTLVMSHNKTLAAQLFAEFKQFFP
ncbi:MAG: hypothetical protein GVY18_12220, partial [Bacteroidetes bacterium]|nr:hypothetical protein [Bacteroidota bacterium]